MQQLGVIAPLPDSPRERREAFLNALLGSILPFVAFYAAWGLLADDMKAYYSRVLLVNQDIIWAQIEGDEIAEPGAVGWIGFSVWAVVLVAVAFGLRWAIKRAGGRLPKVFAFAAVYLELLWVFLSATFVGDAVRGVTGWIDSRQAMVWLADARSWLSDQLAPVAWIWEALEWLLGEAGGIILLPLAWLTIAGVVYGQAVAPQAVRVEHALVERARSRWALVPGWLRARLADLWGEIVSRFRPIGRALVLMWRAGPVLIGGYVLLYTLLLALESLVGIGITRAFGPNELGGFWMVNDQLILLLIPLIIEPLRIALVSGSYDEVIGRLVKRQADAGEPAEPQDVAAVPAEPAIVDGASETEVEQPSAPEPRPRLRARGRGRG